MYAIHQSRESHHKTLRSLLVVMVSRETHEGLCYHPWDQRGSSSRVCCRRGYCLAIWKFGKYVFSVSRSRHALFPAPMCASQVLNKAARQMSGFVEWVQRICNRLNSLPSRSRRHGPLSLRRHSGTGSLPVAEAVDLVGISQRAGRGETKSMMRETAIRYVCSDNCHTVTRPRATPRWPPLQTRSRWLVSCTHASNVRLVACSGRL